MNRPAGPIARLGFHRRPGRVSIFAVEDRAVQVVWRHLEPGAHQVSAATSHLAVTAVVEGDGGPGAVVLDGLPPASEVEVLLDGRRIGRATTLAAPPGEELCRLATVSDTHIGGGVFGRLPTVRLEPLAHDECLRGAIDEVQAWGASLLAVKGDITEQGLPGEWERAAALLSAAGIPVESIPGNHDAWQHLDTGAATFAAAGLRLTVGGVAHHDLPGIRVVLVDSTVPGLDRGAIAPHTEAVCDLVSGAGPAIVLLHQHLQRWTTALHWPPGVPGPEGRAFLDAVARVNPDVVVSSGHSHRHRARRHGPLTVTEVGAPKDFPGTWAGYVVHEGGLVQVVRRVGTPTAIRVAEETSRTFGGAWARWSPGPLEARCLQVAWQRPVMASTARDGGTISVAEGRPSPTEES